jgi:ABC-2 type transport system permease protein
MLVNILVFIIYFSVLIYGNMIAMEVATEKSSRVMEILISSVSPVTQMFAKIAGIALLGLTQQAFILLVAFLSLKQAIPAGQEGGFGEVIGFANIPIGTIGYAVVFFLLGYLLFATLAATLGSLVSRIEDVNQVITPLNLLVIVAFMISMFGLQNPESVFITVTSYIPFFTPMIMFLRVGMLALPMWEIVLGISILIVTITIFALLGARIYRGGVLLYGKSSSLKDIKKALILSKKE